MAEKPSKYSAKSIDRECVFREIFSSSTISQNGGTLGTGVTIDGGIATFASGSHGINYSATQNFSDGNFSLRMRLKTTASGGMGLVYKRFNGSAYCADKILYFGAMNAGAVNFNCDDDSVARQATSSGTVNDGEWHEIIASYDRDGDLNIFIDGLPDGSVSLSTMTGSLSNDNDFVIGDSAGAGTYSFEGEMELFEVYRKALTADEVSLLFSNSLRTPDQESNKSFNVDFRTGSIVDTVDGVVPTNSGSVELRGERGLCRGFLTGDLTYAISPMVDQGFSLLVWVKSQDWSTEYITGAFVDSSNRWYLRADASGTLRLYGKLGGNTFRTLAQDSFSNYINLADYNGRYFCLQLCINRGSGATGMINGTKFTDRDWLDNGGSFSGNLQLGGYQAVYSPAMQIAKCAFYDTCLSDEEMVQNYYEFLSSR